MGDDGGAREGERLRFLRLVGSFNLDLKEVKERWGIKEELDEGDAWLLILGSGDWPTNNVWC